MTRALAAILLAACATARPEVLTADRTDRDKAQDSWRKPAELLSFCGPPAGGHVADLGAGGGYSTELWARAVGPKGAVYAQNPPAWDGDWVQKVWGPRLAKPAMANTSYQFLPWETPLPPKAQQLDAVYSVAVYHDVINEKGDAAKMNKAVFDALKSGGVYCIVDNSAKDGSGAADVGKLHRVDEALVRQQVTEAGFRLAGDAAFLRNANDPRDWNADPGAKDPRSHTQDRFVLRFEKP